MPPQYVDTHSSAAGMDAGNISQVNSAPNQFTNNNVNYAARLRYDSSGQFPALIPNSLQGTVSNSLWGIANHTLPFGSSGQQFNSVSQQQLQQQQQQLQQQQQQLHQQLQFNTRQQFAGGGQQFSVNGKLFGLYDQNLQMYDTNRPTFSDASNRSSDVTNLQGSDS